MSAIRSIHVCMYISVLQDSDKSKASIFTGEEELFAFERVVSRMAEMQTKEYWIQGDQIGMKREKKAKKLKAR